MSLNISLSTVRARHAPQAKARLAGKGGSLAKRRNTGLRGMAGSRGAGLCERCASLHSLDLAKASPALVRRAHRAHRPADERKTYVKGH